MENRMKLWNLIVWNQRFRYIKNMLYVINKNLFFSCAYIKRNTIEYFVLIKKKNFSCADIK